MWILSKILSCPYVHFQCSLKQPFNRLSQTTDIYVVLREGVAEKFSKRELGGLATIHKNAVCWQVTTGLSKLSAFLAEQQIFSHTCRVTKEMCMYCKKCTVI